MDLKKKAVATEWFDETTLGGDWGKLSNPLLLGND